MIRAALFMLLLLTASTSSAQRPIILDPDNSSYSLVGHLSYWEDHDSKQSIDTVKSDAWASKFTASEAEVPNFGFTRSAYWFRFIIENPSPDKRNLVLECSYPLLDKIGFYIERPDKTVVKRVAGDAFPHGNKIIRGHNNFLFPLTIEGGQRHTVFLRVETRGAMQIPLRLWSEQGFWNRQNAVQLVYGVYYGLLLVMILYNLFVFFTVRVRSYLYYVLFVCSVGIYQASADGMAQLYLWPDLPWLGDRIFLLSMYAVGITIPLFARVFLRLPELMPGWNRVVTGCFVFSSIGLLLSFVAPYRIAVVLVALSNPLVGIAVIIVGFVSWHSGFRPARYFAPAMSVYILGGLLWAINKQGLIPRTFLTDAAHEIGLALSVILSAFALADRINVMRRDRWQAQSQLRDAYKRLAGHDRMRTTFITTVSEELRTPLDQLQKPLRELLTTDGQDLPPSVRKKFRSIANNTERLLRLVNQFFDFSRLTTGTTVHYEAVDPREIVQPLIKAFQPLADNRQLKLVLREEADLPDKVYLDPDKLDKVLSNLLSNACKFTSKGGGIVVRLFCDQETLGISVSDSGIGIPQQDLGRIFDRFFQSQQGSSGRYQGTGIGLALSKEFIELMGGTLEVDSELDVGTTFTIALPLEKRHIRHPSQIGHGLFMEPGFTHGDGAASALWAEIGQGSQSPRSSGDVTLPDEDKKDTRPLILVVEDNADMRALVVEICAEEFRVMEAEDGQQGLEMLTKRRPALVISDVLMPRMDGEELVRQIRSHPDLARIPVMLLTAKASQETRLVGLELGADDYLAKPFDSRELLARARNLVRLQRQEHELEELNVQLRREVIRQASTLTRARLLGRYLPPPLVQSILDEGQPVKIEQQRQRLTVFQLELRGFAQLIEITEPEEMSALLNSYLTAMVDIGFSHGATIDKFIRDTVMGFFGAPLSLGPIEDAALCARTVTEMWRQAVDLCDRWQELYKGSPLQPTAILCSGHATVGNFGSDTRMEYTAVGGPVDEASLLLPRLDPGVVVCSQTTWSLIKDQIECSRSAEQVDSGRPRPVDLYRLASLAALGSPRPETPPPLEDQGRSIHGTAKPRRHHDVRVLAPGMVIADRYRIIQQLGEGGMGTVYQAQDQKLDTRVALKLVQAGWETPRSKTKSIRREVKLARLISHPNVASIFDLGEWEGHEFIIMEHIEGQTLRHQIDAFGPYPLEEGQQVILQLCAGLAAAHTVGIVHRDLKPSNVMLGQGNRVVILDFGLARWVSGMHASDSEIGKLAGTPFYMAPEQFKGEGASPQTDIYALGVMSYEMLTGKKPFEADSPVALGYKHVYESPADPQSIRHDLPPLWSAAILKCLEKSPTDRFNSAGEIRALLSGVAARLIP